MKEYLFAAGLTAAMLLLGVGVNRVLDQRRSPTWALVTGFMLFNALFFLPAYIFRALALPFTLLCGVFYILLAAFLIFGLYCLVSRGTYREYCRSVRAFFAERTAAKLLLTLAVAALFALSFYCSENFGPDTDDNYYMAKSLEIIKRNSLSFPEFVAWLGWDDPMMWTSTDASTLEALYACLSVLFGIPVTVMCKKIIVLTVSLTVCCTVFNLGMSLLRDYGSKLKALFFLAVYLLLSLVYRNVFDTVPYRVITTAWHGKTAVCAIVFPAIMTVCMDIYCRGDRIVRSDWALLALFILSSISLSVIGVNFTVLFCLVMAAPLFIYRLISRRKVTQLILPAFLAMLPAVIFSGISLFTVVTANSSYFEDFRLPDIGAAFAKQFLTDSRGIILVLYILALAYFVFRGTWEQRLMLVGTSVFLALTLLNPLLVHPVAKYLTSSSVYWRLYWIIPIWYIIPAAFVSLLSELKPRSVQGFLPPVLITGAAAAALFYSVSGFSAPLCDTLRLNPYALPEATLALADTILEDSDKPMPMLLDLGTELASGNIRQYTADIGFVTGSRHNQFLYRTDIIPGLDKSVYQFVMDCKRGVSDIGADELAKALDYLRPDYLLIRPDILPADAPLSPLLEFGRLTLYRVGE